MIQADAQSWSELSEERLRESEQLYRPLADSIDLVTWMRAPGQDKILYVTPSYERIFGRSRESLYQNSESVFEAIHPEDRERVRSAMHAHKEGGLDEQFRIVTPQGTTRWIRARTFSLPGDGATVTRIAGVAQDITDQKHAEEALKVTLARLRERYIISRRIGTARTADDVVAALRSLSTLSDASRASVLVFDRVGHETAPGNFSLLVDWHDFPPSGQPSDGAVSDLRSIAPLFSREGTILISDAEKDERLSQEARAWLARLETRTLLLFPLITGNEWYGMLVMHLRSSSQLDLNEIDFVEKVINQAAAAIHNFHLLEVETRARKEAEEANETKLRFLAMISHELRTPLTSIKGFATTLLAEDVTWDPESQRDFLETINEEADKLTDLIEHLLDLSRLESGTLRIVPEKRTLRDIVDAVLPQLQELARGHALVVSVPGGLPEVRVDPQRVAQVLTNLVSNAAKYSPSGTRISVSAARIHREIKIDVSDEGPGIPPEKRARVFEPFYQEPGRVSGGGRPKGVGLGLAICKGLVEEHGGRIWVADSPSGATISFTLPVAVRSRKQDR